MADANDNAPITASSFSTDQIIGLWTKTNGRFGRSRKRIRYCHGVQAGGYGAERPDVSTRHDEDEPDPLEVKLPQRRLIASREANRLAANRPTLERRAIGQTQTAIDDAQECQTYVNTAVERAIDSDELYLKLVEDGETYLVALPATEHFEQAPGYDSDDPDPIYYRDGSPKGGKLSTSKPEKATAKANTRRAYEEAHQAYLASCPPWVVRIIPALDCAPILRRSTGQHTAQRFEVRGLIVRTLYDEEELVEQGYIFTSKKDGGWGQKLRALIPRGQSVEQLYGQNGRVYLYEAFMLVPCPKEDPRCKYHPIVAYSVGGQATTRKDSNGKEVDYKRDLREEYGFSELPAARFEGLHSGNDDPDMRCWPLIHPLCSLMVSAESKSTAINVHAWHTQFVGHQLILPPETDKDVYLEQTGELKKEQLPGSGEVTLSTGEFKVVPIAEVGQTARYQWEQEMAMLTTEGPSKELSGGETDRSGHSLSISADLAALADRQIPEGVRQAVEWTGMQLLRIAHCLYERDGIRVPIEMNDEIKPGADTPGEGAAQWRISEYTPRWTGDGKTFRLTGSFPNRGNIAEIQQEADLADRGYSWRERVLEKMGVENIEAALAKIDANAIRKLPEGQLESLARIAAFRGQREREAAIRAQLEKRLAPFGTPVGAMVPPGMAPPGEGMPGTDLPNIAASTLGGINAGALGTGAMMQDAQAAAQLPANGAAGSPNGGAY